MARIRGFDVDLGDLDRIVRRWPHCTDATVVHWQVDGLALLAAYVVSDGDAVESWQSELSTFLRDLLPSHMVPTAYVAMDSLPRTPDGRVEQTRLPMPEVAAAQVPESETLLTELFAESLGCPPDEVGPEDDFFLLGGDSVTAVRFCAALITQTGVEIGLSLLYELGSVRALREHLDSVGVDLTQHGESSQKGHLMPRQPEADSGWTPRFLAVDLDGTIVDRQGNVTEAVLDSLAAAADQGWAVVLATGRSWARTAKVLDRHPALRRHWVICSNGAVLREPGREEPLLALHTGYRDPLPKLRERYPNLIVIAEADSGSYLTTGRLPEEEFDGPQVEIDWTEMAGLSCPRLFLASQTATVEDLEAELAAASDTYDRLVYRLRERTWADLQAAGVSKENTLEQLRLRLGVDSADTLCVGDSWNDIGMLGWAAVGAATDDAPEEVTAVADLIIPSCTEDGVAQLLGRYLS